MQEKSLYPIGEVARMTGVPIKTIRYYSDIGLLPPARTTDARYRLYASGDIWRLELIRVLRHLGFGLQEIEQILAGQRPLEEILDWQMEALDEQILQMKRIRAILLQARQSIGQSSESLGLLYDLGKALDNSASARREFLTRKLRASFSNSLNPPDWQEHFFAHINNLLEKIPETTELSEAQAADWAEVMSMLNDPAFLSAAHQHAAPFWEVMPRDIDINWWNERTQDILARATSVASHQEAMSPQTQELVQEWAELFASAMRCPLDDEFYRWLARFFSTSLSNQERIRHFWTLLTRLANYEMPPSYDPGLLLLTKGLQWRARQE